MNKKITITSIKQSKGNKSLVMITAYDALFAKLLESSADIILVGDSLNMSFAGKADTLSSTMEQMIYHTNAVCNGAKNTFIICDMPFGTYTDKSTALQNALKVFRQTPADSVKIEGGEDKANIVKHLTDNGIAVCGHIGLLPQSQKGKFRFKGNKTTERNKILKEAKILESAGVFSIVLECVEKSLAKEITSSIKIPTIGIGSSANCDGQVLVTDDLLGLNPINLRFFSISCMFHIYPFSILIENSITVIEHINLFRSA